MYSGLMFESFGGFFSRLRCWGLVSTKLVFFLDGGLDWIRQKGSERCIGVDFQGWLYSSC